MKRIAVTLSKLEHALLLRRCGSFSKASQELGIAQPSLSRSISSLEQIWGLQIFERGRSGVRATPNGGEMLDEAEKLLANARTLENNMHARASATAGPITFGMSSLVGTIYLAKILAPLSIISPHLQITSKIEPTPVLQDHLKRDVIEFAIYIGDEPLQDTSLFSEQIGLMPIDLLARADHPLLKGKFVEWDDLRQFPIAGSSYFAMGQEQLTPTIICDDFSVLKELVLGSDVVWLASRFVVGEELAQKKIRLLRRARQSDPAFANIWLTSPRDRIRSPAAELVIKQFVSVYEMIMGIVS